MFKGLARLVPETELNLTKENQQSATNRSGSVHITKYKGTYLHRFKIIDKPREPLQ
jgi:hypothetical protein